MQMHGKILLFASDHASLLWLLLLLLLDMRLHACRMQVAHTAHSMICACSLQAAKKAGKLWAKLVYFVLSPLLALVAVCAVFCLVARGSFAGSAAMTASWVAWPLVKAWSQLKSATRWLHPSKAPIHIVLLLAREPLYSHSLNGSWS